MKLSSRAEKLLTQISNEATKLGDLRIVAKDIKCDHDLAMELWSTGKYLPRQLAILIMDKTFLSQELTDRLDRDMVKHPVHEQNNLIDWLMANQLAKGKRTISLMLTWEQSHSALQRRIFWYYQGRLRWMGQTPPSNTAHLLSAIEARMATEKPQVQWAMNFTAAQIGIHQPEYRTRCIELGTRIGLFKGDVTSKGCTPNYLPDYISVEVTKLKK